jgi:NAD+-dependent protein deacetylase sirtuin 2
MRCGLRVEDQICDGPVKPEITFFGEKLPDRFWYGWDRITNKEWGGLNDTPLYEDGGCDLMIVIGTGLAVYPFQMTVLKPDKECPQVLINLENTEEFDYDDILEYPERLFLKGYCDEIIKKLVKDVGWTDSFEKVMKPKT